MKYRKLVAFAVGTTLNTGVIEIAAAQAGPAPAAVGEQADTGDIIVTARRVEERLQDVPISITVFNQQQLTNRNIVNAADLAAFTPSLSANTGFGSENSSFAIRGFVQDIATPPSVGVYFADVVAPRAQANAIVAGNGAGPGSFFDLQNVQVLKGPQGTLFGRNTTGGAILLVPRKPTARFEGYVEGSLGNYDMRRLQAVVNVPLSETVRIRVGIDRQKRDGYLRNTSGVGPDAFEDLDYFAARASLVLDLTPSLENYTIGSYSKSDRNGSIQKLIACNINSIVGPLACDQLARARARGDGFFTVQSVMTNPFVTLEQWQAVNTTTWRASDTVTVKNIVSYAQVRNNLTTLYPGTDWITSGNRPLLGAEWRRDGTPLVFGTITPPAGENSAEQSTFTEELQLQGRSPDDRLIYQLGGYFESSEPLATSGLHSGVLLACKDGTAVGLQCSDPLGIALSQQFRAPIRVGGITLINGETSFRNVGVYAQATYKLSDAFKLTGGLRYTWDRQTTYSERTTFNFPVVAPLTAPATTTCTDIQAVPPACADTEKQRSSRPTWLLGLDYTPAPETLLYLKYARGYRSGGIVVNSPADYRVFKPEKVDTYEAGLKLSFGGPVRGNLNLAAFYNDFTSQQLQVGITGRPGSGLAPASGIINAGSSRIYGLEAEASLTPFAGFTLDASYAYLNTKVKKVAALVSTDPNYIISAQIPVGAPLVLSPRHKLSMTATYLLPVDAAVGRIGVSATYTYTSSQISTYYYANPANVTALGGDFGTLAARNLVNLNLDWRAVAGSALDLSVFATNVTNEKYYAYVPGLGSAGFDAASVGQPRMYGMRVRVNFGR